jgi:hypothetical protein
MLKWKAVLLLLGVFYSPTILCASNVEDIRKRDIIVWSLGDVKWYDYPLYWMGMKLCPEERRWHHVDIAVENYRGDQTMLLTATRNNLVAYESLLMRTRTFKDCVVLRRKHGIFPRDPLSAPDKLFGTWSAWEGFLSGMDMLFSCGEKDTFRQHMRNNHYTCSTFIARCCGYPDYKLFLPGDFIMSDDLEVVE